MILPLMLAASKVPGIFSEKITRTVKSRRGIKDRWLKKASAIDKNIPTIWIHVSSVGEYLQIRPILDILEVESEKPIQVALTFFSPSGYEYYINSDKAVKNRLIRFTDYLPFDTIRNVRFCQEILNPALMIYVKYDLWPNLVVETSKKNIPQLLLSADLASSEKYLSGFKRFYYGRLYSMMTAIASVSSGDSGQFSYKDSAGPGIVRTGDIRFDQVVSRIENSKISLPQNLLLSNRKFLVAGSTWPEDEELVIDAYKRILSDFDGTGLIIAPHEIDEKRLSEVEKTLSRHGIGHIRLSSLGAESEVDDRVILADGLGYLAELYRVGTIAYVGGSWTTGVHNIMEPAVWGMPVFFGPRIENAWEASELIRIGAASVVKDAGNLADRIRLMLNDPVRLQQAGNAAESFIRENTGASAKCVNLIIELLSKA